MDPDIVNWILEFLIRLPLEGRLLNSLLRSIPLPEDNPSLQKSLLLKKLDNQVAQRSISESTLDFLEKLEEIEFRRGNEAVSDAMKHAYCAVAVDCTLKDMVQGADDDDGKKKYNFFAAVKRLWREKISRMEDVVGKGGLDSELLRAWKDEVEAAVWQDSACQSILEKFKEIQPYEAVGVYLREERDKMGPSFLELVAERVRSDEGLQKILGVDGVAAKETPSCRVDRVAAQETPSCHVDRVAAQEIPSCHVDRVAAEDKPSPHVDRAANGVNASKEKLKGKTKHRNKHVGVKRGAKIADSDETNTESSSLANGAQVNNAPEVLESSSMELQSSVKDPLPKGLRVVEEICMLKKPAEDNDGEATTSEEIRKSKKPAEDDNGGSTIFIMDAAGVVQSSGAMKNVPKPSLMQRNSSACVYEWNDSIDGSPEEVPKVSIQLPSPKRINTSPLKIYNMNNNFKKRRQPRKWSLEEEDALRKGVKLYGKGFWKDILTNLGDSFDGRTEVDLKDKWRNMVK